MEKPSPLKFWSPAYYFIYFIGSASLSPFLVLYYEQRGLSGSQIGLLTSISPLVGLVAAPFWSGIADASRRHKAIFTLTSLGLVTSSLLIYGASTLVLLIPVVSLYAFLSAPVMPLMDSSTMALLGGRRELYGKTRVWGTLGWAVGAPIVGWIVQRSGLQWSFYIFALMMTLGLLISIPIPIGHAHISVPFWSGVRAMFTNRRWMFFLLIIFIGGIGNTAVNGYLFLYLESLGTSKTLIGVALTISTVSEVPVMFFAPRLLQRFKPRGLLLIALSAYVVRLLLYSIVGVPWIILSIQLVHGLTIPMLWVAGVAYAAEFAPPGLGATAQSLFSGVLNGLGGAASALIGGILYQSVGAVMMFRIFALILFVAVALLLVERRLPLDAGQAEAQAQQG